MPSEQKNNSNSKGWKKVRKTTLRTEEGSEKLQKKNNKNREGSAMEVSPSIRVEEAREGVGKDKRGSTRVVEGGSSVLAKEGGGSKKRKIAYIYGNYRFYYGYRVDRDSKEDPRMQAFKKEWFQEKDCLDVGCNQGLITINIAKRFSCRSMLGVDIDGSLIEAANCTLRKMARFDAGSGRMLKHCKSELMDGAVNSEQKISQSTIEKEVQFSECDTPTGRCDLLKKVSFRNENFIEKLDGPTEKYDTVLCLSVSKWIHLNWGDDGLVTLFAKIWRILRPGGIFLFEPQPWKSYGKNRRVSETAKLNFRNIIFTPDLFEVILLDKIGFRSVENLTESLHGTVAGFERPIFVFRK